VDLETIIGELLQYRTSKKLLLQGNKLRTLPHNLSFFKDCTFIDLSDNPITNVHCSHSRSRWSSRDWLHYRS